VTVHLKPRCQHESMIGEHTLLARLTGVLHAGVGLRSGIRRALAPPPPPRAPLGAPSRFAPGSWVRVREETTVRATLDPEHRLRGLLFVPEQFATCGGVYRVDRHVRRILGDDGRMRPVSGTVLLEGVTCAGERGDAGCGRYCPLLYRDEWLEPAAAPADAPPAPGPTPRRFARVRSPGEIRAGLDGAGRQGGVLFTAGMERYAGRVLPVARRLDRVFELDHWVAPRAAVYLLEGAQCPGTPLGSEGPCDLACTLMWHEDWIELDADAPG
jgi:hypothetical protein